MLLIWGFKTKAVIAARIMLICSFCQNPAAQTIVHRKRIFTLFFIPLFPISSKFVMQCAFCGNGGQLTKEQANELIAQAASQQPAAAAPAGPAIEQLPAAEALPATGTDAG